MMRYWENIKKYRNHYISYEDTIMLKGAAILLMLTLHLFNNLASCLLLNNSVVINEKPLSFLFSNFCAICVPMYLFLSGYGLYIASWKENNNNFLRVSLLYVNMWLVGFLFFPFDLFYQPTVFDWSLRGILETISGIHPYNHEWWFIFPWAILCLASTRLMKVLHRNSTLLVLGVYILLRLVLLLYRPNQFADFYYLLYAPKQIIILCFPFLLGAIFAKHGLLCFLKNHYRMISLILGSVSVLFFTFIVHSVSNDILALIVPIVCSALLCFPSQIRRCLKFIGKESTNMWLIHTFICYYYFKSEIYAISYPLLMLVVLLLISYVLSVFVSFIFNPIKILIKTEV